MHTTYSIGYTIHIEFDILCFATPDIEIIAVIGITICKSPK